MGTADKCQWRRAVFMLVEATAHVAARASRATSAPPTGETSWCRSWEHSDAVRHDEDRVFGNIKVLRRVTAMATATTTPRIAAWDRAPQLIRRLGSSRRSAHGRPFRSTDPLRQSVGDCVSSRRRTVRGASLQVGGLGSRRFHGCPPRGWISPLPPARGTAAASVWLSRDAPHPCQRRCC